MRVALATAVCLALILAACQGGPRNGSPSPSLPVTDLSSIKLPSPTPNSTPAASPGSPSSTPKKPATPTPIELSPTEPPEPTSTPVSTASVNPPTPAPSRIASATPAADCVNGWVSPAEDSPEWNAAFEMMETKMDVTGPWTVENIRYFTGPDVPWIIEPHYDVVQYWYVKAARADEPTFAARWLIEQRTEFIRDVTAIAPANTTGYTSPDWTAFVGDGAPVIYTGLPGEWSGIPYDFVTGEGDSGQPGLPDEVIGCLSGT